MMVQFSWNAESFAGCLKAVRFIPKSPTKSPEVQKATGDVRNQPLLRYFAALADACKANECRFTVLGCDDDSWTERVFTALTRFRIVILEHHERPDFVSTASLPVIQR